MSDDYIGLWQIDQTIFRYELQAAMQPRFVPLPIEWTVYQADYSRYLRPRLYSRAWWRELGRDMRTAVVDAWRAESDRQA